MLKLDNDQESILLISRNADKAKELAKLFEEKGYKTFTESSYTDFERWDREHLVLILLVDCADACAPIIEHLTHLHGNISTIPLVFMSDSESIRSKEFSNIEQVSIEEFLPRSEAVDALLSRVEFWRQKHPQIVEKKTKLSAPSSDVSLAQQKNDLITLMVISERAELYNRLQTYFCGIPNINLANGCLTSPQLILDKLEEFHPDILLVDTVISNPTVTVIDWLYTIRSKDALIKIILVQDNEIPGLINKIIRFNIFGVISSNASCDVYCKAIRIVHNGELWMRHHVVSQIFDFFSEQYGRDYSAVSSLPILSMRERGIAELVAQGLTNKEIARQLNISPETVKKHLKNIFGKFSAQKRSEIASKYVTMVGRAIERTS